MSLRWAMADGWTITRRDLLHQIKEPAPVIVGLLFPVMMVLMFGYLFGGAMTVPGGGDYREFLMPGLFALTMVFGIEATFAAVTTDINRGITDRFRSMPMAGSAVMLGRSAADMFNTVLGLIVLVGTALVVGWRWHDGIGNMLLAFALLLLLRFAMLWLGIYFALVLKSPQAVMMLQILVWPLGFTSSAFVAPSTMPGWLGVIAEWNPLSATASAARMLFGNPGWGGESWIATHPVLMAIVWPVVLLAIFFPLSVRKYLALSR